MKKKALFSILIAAGGSGGHLLPAQRLAVLLKEKNPAYSCVFAGYRLAVSPFFEKNSFSFYDIAGAPLSAKKIFGFFYNTCKGFFQSVRMIRKVRPSIVIGFGSFHVFPVLLAALVLRKPIILYESNIMMGKVNRFFYRFASLVAMQFPIEKNACVVNPFHVLAAQAEKQQDSFTFLVFGGSQGAKQINEMFSQVAVQLKKNQIPFHVIHLTGNEKETEKIKTLYRKFAISAEVCSFEKNMPMLYAQADLAICRSGAMTLSEIIHFELPALLIPYPFSKNQHQQKNADFFATIVKGGQVIDPSSEDVYSVIVSFLQNKEKLQKMKENIKNYKMLHKHEDFVSLIEKIMEKVCSNKKTII